MSYIQTVFASVFTDIQTVILGVFTIQSMSTGVGYIWASSTTSVSDHRSIKNCSVRTIAITVVPLNDSYASVNGQATLTLEPNKVRPTTWGRLYAILLFA